MKNGQYDMNDYNLQKVEVRIKLQESSKLYSAEPLDSPESAIKVMADVMKTLDREYVCVVNLDQHCKPLNYTVTGIGTISSCLVDKANIFKSAILSNAAHIIMLHNHPSGDLTPSAEDFNVTESLIEAGKLMGIPILDHIIVGGINGEKYSFKENTTLFDGSEKKRDRTDETGKSGSVGEPGYHHAEKGEKKMDFEGFRDQIKEELKEELPGMKIENADVEKLQGESYRGISIGPEGSGIGVNVSLEKFFDQADEGRDIRDIAGDIKKTVDSAAKEMPTKEAVKSITEYDNAKKNLFIEVVNTDHNAEMLKNVPHKNIEDLSAVCRIDASKEAGYGASVLVNNKMMAAFGITAAELFADAEQMAPISHPAKVVTLSSMVNELIGGNPAEEVNSGSPQTLVATVESKTLGAGIIDYPDFMKDMADQIGGDFFVLPSSIHEVLIMPDDGVTSLRGLEDMVHEVNRTQVDPSEQLSDSVYHYDSKERTFELGSKFEDRKAEKDLSKAQNREKTEKASIRKDLDKKKNERSKAEVKFAEPSKRYKGAEL